MSSILRRLVLESMRARPYQTGGTATSVALACAALLSGVGTHAGIGREPSLQRLMIGLWTSGLLMWVAGIALLVVMLAQYIEVRERTLDYGMLRVLGASTRYFLVLLIQESLLLALAGTVLGIALTYVAKTIVALAFPTYLALNTVCGWWPLASLCSFFALMLGGLLGVRVAIRDGVEEALSYRK
jgi:putative ABC transport system permease protein